MQKLDKIFSRKLEKYLREHDILNLCIGLLLEVLFVTISEQCYVIYKNLFNRVNFILSVNSFTIV